MIVKRQSPSGSPRQDCALAVWVGRCRSFGMLLFILNLDDGDNSSVLAAVGPLSSTTIYPGVLEYRHLLGSSREERNSAGISRLLMRYRHWLRQKTLTLTTAPERLSPNHYLDVFVVHFLHSDKSSERRSYVMF